MRRDESAESSREEEKGEEEENEEEEEEEEEEKKEDDVRRTRRGAAAHITPQYTASIMDAFQLIPLLLVTAVTAAASMRPPRHVPPCQVVHTDVLCSDLRLTGAPAHLPQGVQMLDLSRNQVQNLTRETLAYHTDLRHLNLHANKIHFIQPGLFRDMTHLKVLDLSRNHLNVLALSKVNVGPLRSVESLDLSHNGLYTGMSDYFLSDSPSLLNLSLNSNSITKISQNTFSGSLTLRKISLHNNIILEIEDGAFDSLDHLTELDLSKNSISCITDFNLHHLKLLNLSRNSVELFHSSPSGDFYQLVSLDLSQNKLPYFPLLPENNVLEYLDVSRNQLQCVNVSGSSDQEAHLIFNQLRFLDMSYNQLTSVPECFFYCMGRLEVLNVSNNCIASFSVTNEDVLQRVRIINLSHNALRSLTLAESSLQSLEKLLVQGNDLSTLDPHVFQRLSSLKYLQLQQNNLEVCGTEEDRKDPASADQNQQADPSGCVSFSSVQNLQVLHLSENNLRTLPANAFTNTPLKLLDLSLNPGLDMDVDSLSGLQDSLAHLLLRENNLSSLNADLSSLHRLKHVDLSTNQLTALPTWNTESSIESLNLQNNHLVTLEYRTMTVLEPSLKTLYMGSNPLSCCSNLDFLRMVQRSAVVVADIETVTCVHHEFSEPVNIEKLTEEMCHGPYVPKYIAAAVVLVTLLLVALVFGLSVKCCHARKQKHNRSFSA